MIIKWTWKWRCRSPYGCLFIHNNHSNPIPLPHTPSFRAGAAQSSNYPHTFHANYPIPRHPKNGDIFRRLIPSSERVASRSHSGEVTSCLHGSVPDPCLNEGGGMVTSWVPWSKPEVIMVWAEQISHKQPKNPEGKQRKSLDMRWICIQNFDKKKLCARSNFLQ